MQFPCHGGRRTGLSPLLLVLGGLLGCSGGDAVSEALPEWIPPAAVEMAASNPLLPGLVDDLTVRARTAAERLRYTADVAELEPARAELELCLGTLALLPEAADLPWQSWIEQSRFTLPELAEAQMRAAGVALGAEVLPVAREMDFREMPTGARIEAHLLFWEHDPGEALTRSRALLLRERPRNQDRLRPAYVERVLVPNPSPLVEELLLDVCTSDRMEARARTLAVRSLRDRGSVEAPAILESLFDTEGRNFLLRKEALSAILALDPPRAHRILLERMPSREIDRGMWEFMRELRELEGLPAPGEEGT